MRAFIACLGLTALLAFAGCGADDPEYTPVVPKDPLTHEEVETPDGPVDCIYHDDAGGVSCDWAEDNE